MTARRYVVLGLARARAPWFAEVARWANAAALPLEFVKCLSASELRARLASGRAWSAVLVDGGAVGVDRDLLDSARVAGAAALVVDDGRAPRDWASLGATATTAPPVSASELLALLDAHAVPVDRVDRVAPTTGPSPPRWQGTLVAVTGPGGTGASVVAAGLAGALAAEARNDGMVLLADLALHADQAVLHDAGDVVPGLTELVDAHRLGRPAPEEVRRTCLAGGPGRHDLLCGLRRPRDWAALRPRAIDATIDGLRAAYRWVVADVGPDLDGVDDTGSVEVDERHHLTRSAVRTAAAVVVVCRPGPTGVHRGAVLLRDLARTGVDPSRIIAVVNRSPRSPAARAEIGRALAALADDGPATIVHLPTVRGLDERIRVDGRVPTTVGARVVGAVSTVVERAPAAEPFDAAPVPVAPGSLGRFAEEGA